MINNPIFIIGCSRSGTCFLGKVLKKHANIHCLIEYPEVFRYANYLALNPEEKHKNFAKNVKKLQKVYTKAWKPGLGKCYRCSSICKKAAGISSLLASCYPQNPQRYADKSHQHVVNVKILMEAFPEAQFIHIIRDGRDVVSSMLQHHSIPQRFSEKYISKSSQWPQTWYGVTNAEHYEEWVQWSLEKKCALAWVSRIAEGTKAGKDMDKSQWLDIRYENLVTNPNEVGEKIFRFLNLPIDCSALQDAKASSVGSWKKRMTAEQVSQILEVMGETLETLGYAVE